MCRTHSFTPTSLLSSQAPKTVLSKSGTAARIDWRTPIATHSSELDVSPYDRNQRTWRIQLSTREIGSTEIHATSLQHSPNGRFITVVGDGEYIIYTALAEQGVRYGVELLVGLELKHVHCARREDEGEGLQKLQGADDAGDEG
jgi:hypothetical protein